MARQTIDDVSSIDSPEISAPAIVMIASGTTQYALAFEPVGVVQLGRRITSGKFTAEIDDERVSREHATVEWQGGGWCIVDLDSRNGTFVDGARLAGEVTRAGDVVLRLGHTVFVLVRDGRGHLAPREDGATVIGPELSRAYDAIRRNATQESDTLLLHGESGSGKELAARLYHDTRTPDGPFIAVNCATIPEGVAERLLFGSKRGAFSGAIDAVGYLQSAHGGTLFLDEIADLDPAVQAKLLRVLETRDVLPIGATSPVAVELGVVAASHRELRTAIVDKRFREDLYYRINVIHVPLPPLRARAGDVLLLAQHLLRKSAVVLDKKVVALSPAAAERLLAHDWPGNVRELANCIERAVAVAHFEDIQVEDLPEKIRDRKARNAALSGSDLPELLTLEEIERRHVMRVLEACKGNRTDAAKILEVDRKTLYRKLLRWGVPES